MPDTAAIGSAYDANAARYAEYVSDPANRQPLPDAMVAAFADSVQGRVLDAGCGPGQWTAYLCERGLAAEGVDLSPGQLAIARAQHPDVPFAMASSLALPADDATYGGVLAHFSLIHTPPRDVPTALREFARVLVPGGTLLLGGFATLDPSPDWVEYDHTLCPAFRWRPDALAEVVREAGLDETARLVLQPPPTARSAAVYLFATKTAS